RLNEPQLLAVVGIETVEGARAVKDDFLLAAGEIDDGGRGPAIAVDAGLPQPFAGVLVESDDAGQLDRGVHDELVAEQDGTGAGAERADDAADLLVPNQLAVEIEGADAVAAEVNVDACAIAGRRAGRETV